MDNFSKASSTHSMILIIFPISYSISSYVQEKIKILEDFVQIAICYSINSLKKLR